MSTHLPPSFRRQQLVLDFASVLPLLPEGVYLSLSSSDPSIWSGVLFVRDSGPYESLVARFTISFPPAYPDTAPFVTFQTDLFHPLILPLTTYAFSGAWDAAGVSAGDVEGRLPPGAFSLSYGFPHWFGRSGAAAEPGSAIVSSTPSTQPAAQDVTRASVHKDDNAQPPNHDPSSTRTTTLALLTHILATFTTPTLLDALPLSSAGNTSAWHAWRSYRGLTHHPPRGRSAAPATHTRDAEAKVRIKDEQRSQATPRHPSEWNWDGVFESRVREGVESSVSDATLYGSSQAGAGMGGNIGHGIRGQDAGQIRFEKLDAEKLEEIRRDIRQGRTLVS